MNEHEALMIAGNVMNRSLSEEKSKEIRQIINHLLNNSEIVSKEEAEKL